MDESEGSHRTRSKAAPDWTVEESLALVNEIHAVESEWGGTLPSFQKWQQIVENCNALGVNRNLNQCKRKWDALLAEYRLAKNRGRANESFPVELFNAIDGCVNASGKRNEGDVGGVEEEEQEVMDTDPDSNAEEQIRVTDVLFATGSKKQRRRMKRQNRRGERQNPWGYFTSPNINHEEPSSIKKNLGFLHKNIVEIVKHEEPSSINKQKGILNKNIVKTVPDQTTVETEQHVATLLWDNALQINAILEGNLEDEADYKLSADMKNDETVQTDFIRRQGDKLIGCLENLLTTLGDFLQT